MNFLRMIDLDLAGKRVLIREDLNVPVKDGRIGSEQRLAASLPTIRTAAAAGAQVLVMSHLGRPKEGQFDAAASLAPVAAWLSQHPGFEVPLHRSLTEPILLGGAPRTVAIANGTLAAAVGLGLQLWIPGAVLWIVGHSLAVWGARVDPQFMQVFAKHLKHKPLLDV